MPGKSRSAQGGQIKSRGDKWDQEYPEAFRHKTTLIRIYGSPCTWKWDGETFEKWDGVTEIYKSVYTLLL